MTTSGYPRISKIWKRGTPLTEATILFEGNEKDLGIWGSADYTVERTYTIVYQAITFYTSNKYVMEGSELIKLDIPEDSSLHGFFKDNLFFIDNDQFFLYKHNDDLSLADAINLLQ